MGRHRRATPAPAPRIPAQRTARVSSSASAGRHRGDHRKGGGVGTPVRTGLLGVSAAMAMGAVAVASGLVPGPNDGFGFGDESSSKVQANGIPDLETQGDTERTENPPAGRGGDRTTPSPSPSESESSKKPEKSKPSEDETTPSEKPDKSKPSGDKTTPAKPDKPGKPDKSEKEKKPQKPASPSDEVGAAQAEVLKLVNQERAKAGCQPLKADLELADLAGDYSEDMAVRGFFSHTSPDGESPWDRADAAGIDNLAAENIARGQANAQSVMDAWMTSPGHRANILNCDYKTLGVGAHFAPGGPWWTQNFGY